MERVYINKFLSVKEVKDARIRVLDDKKTKVLNIGEMTLFMDNKIIDEMILKLLKLKKIGDKK
jgi:hypothetical protein